MVGSTFIQSISIVIANRAVKVTNGIANRIVDVMENTLKGNIATKTKKWNTKENSNFCNCIYAQITSKGVTSRPIIRRVQSLKFLDLLVYCQPAEIEFQLQQYFGVYGNKSCSKGSISGFGTDYLLVDCRVLSTRAMLIGGQISI